MADSSGLRAAAQRKRENTIRRARDAVRELDEEGELLTFQAVARRAGVSRQWLYTQPELRADIERLRELGSGSAGVPSRQRSSDASLRQRIETLLLENGRLREENAGLKTELESAYGSARA